jgi:dihydroorotate dehydrogenase (fumarate)
MIDLSTNYLGLKLRNPIVASASPLTEKLENFARLEDAGASAIVMHSLMEEQIEAESENIDNALEYGANSYAESTSYLPDMQKYNVGPDRYLELLHQGKKSVSIPVIASLNGRSPWNSTSSMSPPIRIFLRAIWRRVTATSCAPFAKAFASLSR